VRRYGSNIVIIHGGASGIDESFDLACRGMRIQFEPHPADWDRLGDRAGPIRNGEMVRSGVALCLVFHRFLANSKGSKDCARQAIAAGVPTYLIDSDRVVPRRLRADYPRLE
jgi:hypothetical protein